MQKLIEQFKALPPWQRYVLILVLPLVLIVYIWLMLLSPAMDEVSKLKVEVNNAKADIQRIRASLNPAILENLRKEEKALEEEYLTKQAELVSLVGEIPTEKDVGKIIANIGRIAKRSKVKILNLQVSGAQKVSYAITQEGEKKVVKELQQQQQTQQQGQKGQQQTGQQPQEGVTLLRSEVKMTLLGDYASVRAFLDGMRREGIISYPVSLSLSSEGNKLRAEMVINILMKEGQEL
ncbi:MAG: hypothetical protein WKI46_01735 [Aquificaceae bacterium]|uniref:hypothetical protein n=1 Tax=Pampinifervens florentissimum TaxID=1632019 RepID=UPI0013B47B89|nr:hypothetical protein [Hydrogenobacter sp. T-8]QID32495.1 hypothetical protein G3M65_01340 [Hydrogenobacter sp. T-8]